MFLFSFPLLGFIFCSWTFTKGNLAEMSDPNVKDTLLVAPALYPSFLPDFFKNNGVSYALKPNGKYKITFTTNIVFPEASTTIRDNATTWPTKNGQDAPDTTASIDDDLRSFTNGNSRGFYWKVPTEVEEIVINAQVVVTGGFWTSGQNLIIHGATTDRTKHTLQGSEDGYWKNGRTADNTNEWRYTAISGFGGGTVTIENLTVAKARAYNINSYDTKMIADNIRIINGRDVNETLGNNDGFGGGAGSEIRNSLINVTDDGVKFYRNDQKAINCTIHHNKNGAPFQFGWGSEQGATGCEITDCTIVRNPTVANYNLAPLTLTNRKATAVELVVDVIIKKGNNGGVEGLEFVNGDYTGKKIISQFSGAPFIPLVAGRTSKTIGANNASISIKGKGNVLGFTSSDVDWQHTQGQCNISFF